MLADPKRRVEFVVGVDTHRDQHALVVVDAISGKMCAETVVVASRAGYAQALEFVDRHAVGDRCWAVEGTGSYGAGLCRFLSGRGERVWEVERPHRRGRDGRMKDDFLDARRAAQQVLAGGGSTPRQGMDTEPLRLLVRTREGAVTARTEAVNQLYAAIVTAPDELRQQLTGLSRPRLLAACRLLRARPDHPQQTIFVMVVHGLARRIRELSTEADRLKQEIQRQVTAHTPALLQRRGVGPISAAELLVSWSHPGRVKNEAGFARLAGVAPIPASSGQTKRHRLDRGGDRHLNRALHTIALSLARTDPRTQAFIATRTARGKTRREAIRLLKRYLARSLYRQLEATTTT
jgi:transposase